MDSGRVNLLGSDRNELGGFITDLGEPEFRSKQILRWLHQEGCTDFTGMTDLPVSLRDSLEQKASLVTPPIIADSLAKDGTRKWLYQTDKGAIEAVMIPQGKRRTLCVSSQLGCALACTFCLTGKQGFAGNLTSDQIVAQLTVANRLLGADNRITNVVFMGMGEPLLNLKAVVQSINLMKDQFAYGLSRRRITVSTAGVVPAIERLAQQAPVALAISLHAADSDLRSELVPINKKYPLDSLLEACRRYLEIAPRDFITFEYVLLEGVNDSLAQASDLAKLIRTVPSKVNLIPFNPFVGSEYRRPSLEAVIAFRDRLNAAGQIAMIRWPRGDDILAACGQLKGNVQGRLVSIRSN